MLLPLKSVHAFTYLPLIYLNGNKGFQFLFAVKGWWLFIKRLFTGSRALNSLFVFFLSFDHRKIIPSKQSIDNLWAVNVLKKTCSQFGFMNYQCQCPRSHSPWSESLDHTTVLYHQAGLSYINLWRGQCDQL